MQGKQRAIMGAMQEPSLPESVNANKGLLDGHLSGPFLTGPGDLQKWAQVQDGFENEEEFFSSQIGRKSQSAFYPEDDDYFFAAGQPGSHSHTQGTLGSLSRGDPGRWEGVSPAHQAQRRPGKKRHRPQGRSHVLEEDEEGDRLYSSMSRAFLHRLWKGNVSSKMLNPRLQKAMKDYLSANKHGVRFRGKRAAGRSRAALLCALRRRVRVRTLDGTEPPFSALGWRALVPAVPLSQLHPRGLRSCAVVMSAGAILNSSLGEEIGGCHLGVSGSSPGLGASCRLASFPPAFGSHWQGPSGPALDVLDISWRVLFPRWDRRSLFGTPTEEFCDANLDPRRSPHSWVPGPRPAFCCLTALSLLLSQTSSPLETMF